MILWRPCGKVARGSRTLPGKLHKDGTHAGDYAAGIHRRVGLNLGVPVWARTSKPRERWRAFGWLLGQHYAGKAKRGAEHMQGSHGAIRLIAVVTLGLRGGRGRQHCCPEGADRPALAATGGPPGGGP